MKRFYLILTFIILGQFIAKAQQIVFTPKWTAQAQFTGYYVAEKLGYYKAEGLDVRIQHPSISESSFSFLEKGRAQVVVMNLSHALTAWVAGVKVVNVMQSSQTNSLMLVGNKPFKGIASLQNKKIAVWNHLSQDLLNTLAKTYNLNIEWIRFNSGINLFLSGAVDLCLVGSYNEFPQLAEYGMNIDPTHVFRLADYGYDLPEDGLYVTEDFYHAHPELIQKFVRASIRGWQWANNNREKALDIVMGEVRKNNVGTNRYHQRKMLEEILRLQSDRITSKRTFKLSRKSFENAMRCLVLDKTVRNQMYYEDFVK